MADLDKASKRVLTDVRNAVPAGDDYTPAMTAYREYCSTGTCQDADARIAFDIHRDSTQREIVEALLLSNCPSYLMNEVFSVPEASTRIYQEIFFDTSQFPTVLDKISYLENYGDPFGKALKVRADSLGYEYVLYIYAHLVPETNAQRKLLERMFMNTAYKAMSILFNQSTDSISKNVLEYAKLMVKAYETLHKNNETESADRADRLIEVITAEMPPEMARLNRADIF